MAHLTTRRLIEIADAAPSTPRSEIRRRLRGPYPPDDRTHARFAADAREIAETLEDRLADQADRSPGPEWTEIAADHRARAAALRRIADRLNPPRPRSRP